MKWQMVGSDPTLAGASGSSVSPRQRAVMARQFMALRWRVTITRCICRLKSAMFIPTCPAQSVTCWWCLCPSFLFVATHELDTPTLISSADVTDASRNSFIHWFISIHAASPEASLA